MSVQTYPRPAVPDVSPDVARRLEAPQAVVVALAAVVGGLEFLLVHHKLVDDAYITLDYARTLGLHGQWGMVEGLTSNTATSPLNVIVLGAITFVVRSAVRAAGIALVALFALTAWWLHGAGESLGQRRWRLPLLGVGFLASMPLLVSTVGLESYLAATVMVGLVRYSLARCWWAVGVLAGLITLTRPDLIVFGLAAVILAGRSCWKVAAAAIATSLPWFVFSWYALGSAVPDSMLLKAGMPWGFWNYANGFTLWYGFFPAAVLVSMIPAAIGLLCAPWWWRSGRPVVVVWGAGAIAHAVLFILLNAAPFHWYYAPVLTGLGLIAVTSAARASRGALIAAGVFLGFAAGIDVRGGPVPDFAPISSNWATAAQYQALAETLPAGATVAPPGEIGTLAFYCHCRVLDGFADRGYMRELLDQRRAEGGPLWRRLLDLNYRNFHPDPPQPLDYRINAPLVPVTTPHSFTGAWGDQRQVTVTPAR